MARLSTMIGMLGLAAAGLGFCGTTTRAETFVPPPAGLEGLSPLAPYLTPSATPSTNWDTPAAATPRPAPITYTTPVYTPPVYTPPVYSQPVYPPTPQPVYSMQAFWPQSQHEALPLDQVQFMQQMSVGAIQQLARDPYTTAAEMNQAFGNLAYWNNVWNWKVQQMQAARRYQY